MNVSYGAITAPLIGYTLSAGISLTVLNKKYNFSFIETIKRLPKFIFSWFIFIIIILLLKLFIPINLDNRLLQIPILTIYGIVSFLIYIFINYKNNIIKEILGDSINNKIKKILK